MVLVAGQPPEGMVGKERIGRKLMVEGPSPSRRPSPIELALKYAEVLQEPSVVSKAQVAHRFGVSRARVCQVLKILELDDSILEFIKAEANTKGTNYFTERKLRPIAAIQDRNQQVRMFNKLVREMYLYQ